MVVMVLNAAQAAAYKAANPAIQACVYLTQAPFDGCAGEAPVRNNA